MKHFAIDIQTLSIETIDLEEFFGRSNPIIAGKPRYQYDGEFKQWIGHFEVIDNNPETAYSNYMDRLKGLTLQDPERAEVRVFDSYDEAKQALWEIIFEMYEDEAKEFYNLPDAEAEDFREWIEEWKWREDLAKEELKKHGDYNAPKTAN